MFLLGISFDEMDHAGDIGVLYPNHANYYFSIIASSPVAGGKSLATNGPFGDDYFRISMGSNQAGKVLNFGIHARIINTGVFFSLHSTDVGNGFAQQISIRRNGSGYLQLRRGNTTLATGETYIDPNSFTFFQITVFIDAAGYCAVRLNGNPDPDINFSGDTQNQETNSVWQFSLGKDGLENIASSHFYQIVVFNSDGTANNGLVPPKLTPVHIHADADGATTWTPSTGADAYALIDDPIGAPNDTDYASTSTLNAKNRCLLAAQTAIGDVAAVQVLSRFEKSGVGTLAVKSGLIAGANEVQSAEKYLPDGISNYLDTFEFKTGSTPFAAADLESGDMEITAQLTAVS
jgi:hypothetical protein